MRISKISITTADGEVYNAYNSSVKLSNKELNRENKFLLVNSETGKPVGWYKINLEELV